MLDSYRDCVESVGNHLEIFVISTKPSLCWIFLGLALWCKVQWQPSTAASHMGSSPNSGCLTFHPVPWEAPGKAAKDGPNVCAPAPTYWDPGGVGLWVLARYRPCSCGYLNISFSPSPSVTLLFKQTSRSWRQLFSNILLRYSKLNCWISFSDYLLYKSFLCWSYILQPEWACSLVLLVSSWILVCSM